MNRLVWHSLGRGLAFSQDCRLFGLELTNLGRTLLCIKNTADECVGREMRSWLVCRHSGRQGAGSGLAASSIG